LNIRQSIIEKGFAIIPNVFDADEISRTNDLLCETSLRRSKAGIRHALAEPAVVTLASDARLLSIGQEILGPSAIPFRATIFDKSRLSNWLVVWHQDTALPLRARHDAPSWGSWSVKSGILYAHAPASALSRVVAIRVHLDDSTQDNGPLRVLPGTHSRGILTDVEIHQLAEGMAPMDCLAERGGILVMSPLIVHSSSKSRSGRSRRVLHIEYAASLQIADGIQLALA
jgi:ectoine hydroxylase-related dioxygenase (phytanoyl-CoA dioxygenase family)